MRLLRLSDFHFTSQTMLSARALCRGGLCRDEPSRRNLRKTWVTAQTGSTPPCPALLLVFLSVCLEELRFCLHTWSGRHGDGVQILLPGWDGGVSRTLLRTAKPPILTPAWGWSISKIPRIRGCGRTWLIWEVGRGWANDLICKDRARGPEGRRGGEGLEPCSRMCQNSLAPSRNLSVVNCSALL